MTEIDNKKLTVGTLLVFISGMTTATLAPILTSNLGFKTEERMQDIENIKRFSDLVSVVNGYGPVNISEPCIQYLVQRTDLRSISGRFLGDACGVRADLPGASQLASMQLLATLGIRYPSYRRAAITALEHLYTTLPLLPPPKDEYHKANGEALANEAKRLAFRLKEYNRTHPDQEASALD